MSSYDWQDIKVHWKKSKYLREKKINKKNK